jgi:hypothetical protein
MCRFMYIEAFLKNIIKVTYYAHLRYARFAYPWFCISVTETVNVLSAATVGTAAHAQ